MTTPTAAQWYAAQARIAALEAALHKIDANAAESPQWIRRTAREALNEAEATT